MYLFSFSEHHNKHEDRLWDFGCKATLDSYQCPSHQVITGMNSYHENKHENRRRTLSHNYVNWFDEAFTFDVPPNSYLIAVESFHENKHEDLRWKYQYWAERSC
uniref:Uncharacterized protein n=1 Tax=Oncorhynchus kisutch TaxID=8019 RepID=A0A8C7IIV8_ONCKI